MKRFFSIALVLTLLPAVVFAATKKPIVLLFPVKAGEGANVSMEAEATQALKTYLRETGRADVADFDPESVMFRRALDEGRIQPSDLVAITTPEARLRIALLLGVDLAVAGEIVIKDEQVHVGTWLGESRTKKIWKLEAAAAIAKGTLRERATSNAMQSAASTVVFQLVSEALKNVKPEAPVAPTDPTVDGTAPRTVEPEYVQPADDAATYVSRAEGFTKSGDDASAVLEYRRAINSDPRNIDIRLKLAQLYSKRKMYAQSIGELERAQAIAPGSDAVRRELANVYTQKGAPEKAAAVYANQADSNPKDIASRLSAGDYYLQQNMLQDAEKQYRLAAQADPASPVPHDRLAMFFASQLKFTESCAEVDQLQRLDQKPDLKAFLDRYSRLKGYADGELKSILADYDAGATAFANHKMTREAYYDYVRKVSARIEPVAHYLDVLAPPDSAATSHRHRTLGCSLLSQACTHLMRYLETNKSSEMDSATIFISEARKHVTQAG